MFNSVLVNNARTPVQRVVRAPEAGR